MSSVSMSSFWAQREVKRKDVGLYEMVTINPLEPEAWLFVDDATSDGTGTEYVIFSSSFVTPGPANPHVSRDIVLDQVNDPLTLGEALSHIVSTYAHVNHVSELTVHKHTVTTVQ